ncbi:MAG TPA: hypothetical protein VFS91_08890 [Nitrobacter sp.]|nr:hypothetical protein [Nitrobacter sp.]
MFQLSAGVLGALAVMLPLGAVHFVSDHALTAGDNMTAAAVNRDVKSDRDVVVQSSHMNGRTVSIRLESLPDTSIMFRIPGSYRMEAGDRLTTKRDSGRTPARQVRRTIACEPVVSVLTDIAKQLQPGRCVT